MKAAAGALVAASVFFAAVLFGSAGRSSDAAVPKPVILVTSPRVPEGATGTARSGDVPAPAELEIEDIEHDVAEGSVEDYDDHDGEEGDDDGGVDNSGPGSDSSGSGSSGSGSSGSSASSGSGGGDD